MRVVEFVNIVIESMRLRGLKDIVKMYATHAGFRTGVEKINLNLSKNLVESVRNVGIATAMPP
jgi:hypothetical protein